MDFYAKGGTWLAKQAAKLGIKRLFRPSLEMRQIDFDPIRRSGDDINEGPAIVYTIDVENIGSKTAKNCRAYLQLKGVWEPEDSLAEISIGGEETEIQADKVSFSLDTQVFWSDDVEARNHIQDGGAKGVVSEKSLSAGETGTVSFALLIGGNKQRKAVIRFATTKGFQPSAMPDLEFDGFPYSPAVAGDQSAPETLSAEIPVTELDRFDWERSRIYVTSENTVGADFHFRFLFRDNEFTIKHESVDESVFEQ